MTPKPRALVAAPVLVAAGLVAGCAGKLPPCPAAGGPAWRELSSAHFRLRTDADPDVARSTLRDLEQFQAALLTVFRAAPDLRTGRLPAILVREGWDDFADPEHVGWFTHALFQPLVVMKAYSTLSRQDVIKHELVHYLSTKVMPFQPPWFSEGLASYFETLDYDADTGQVTVGRPPSRLLALAQNGARVSLPELFAADKIDEDRGVFYASAWATVHFLMNRHPAELRAYETALKARLPAAAAWTQAFGKLTPTDLEFELASYLDGGRYSLLVFRFVAQSEPIAARSMSDAEAHATRAELLLKGPRNAAAAAGERQDLEQRARREIAEALRLDPGSLAARALGHYELRAPVDLDVAERAIEANPNDWMAWLLLAEGFRERHLPAQEDTAEKAVELASDDPSVTIILIRTVTSASKP